MQKIIQTKDGIVQIIGQWFYRPEEVEKEGGGTWTSSNSKELFYSFHIDEIPIESIMHKCQIYFIPLNKHLPQSHKYPGFIVHWIYDVCKKKLCNLSDKEYKKSMQEEIDFFVERTYKALKELSNIDNDEHITHEHEDILLESKLKKKVPTKRILTPLNLSSEEYNVNEFKNEALTPNKQVENAKVETPMSVSSTDLEISTLLKNHGAILGVHARDRWMEKLMKTIKNLCEGENGFTLMNEHKEDIKKDDDANKECDSTNVERDKQSLEGDKEIIVSIFIHYVVHNSIK